MDINKATLKTYLLLELPCNNWNCCTEILSTYSGALPQRVQGWCGESDTSRTLRVAGTKRCMQKSCIIIIHASERQHYMQNTCSPVLRLSCDGCIWREDSQDHFISLNKNEYRVVGGAVTQNLRTHSTKSSLKDPSKKHRYCKLGVWIPQTWAESQSFA